MKPSEIADTLTNLFGAESVNAVAPGSWQIEAPTYRLLVILSDDESWLRILLPIVSVHEALPFVEQFLEANFDDTQQVRYAIQQNVVWGVFQHNCNTLVVEDFHEAIDQLKILHEIGLDDVFNRLIERRIRQIIQAAKQQGQSLQTTMQNLERLYAEGVMGEIDQNPEVQEEVLAAWRRQLQSLWDEVEA
ncbi:hypothetical protein G7B40_034515 [Aetokthonos hydrillicola Thurmond2011]|jgi:hypothetical protein|uniref:DNA-binding domain-containing protein n=1 Tax=Aetokthonos hydrillicola Thurmond2011 TaxID=2712845 RepID=A0AAP5IDF6_9CYAN|nr:hypothetical protein [Aetokthonos hydrillicola]MBO3458050.1 hypothetical protein [Aetokthonos hydrillicola CCALA 1050]MBW4587115.1 hypothetical protein [Aetokthonos hydrillicola CCALA 1050]MDR9899635.1 hypothetical protein [Aetokthonos hydrillicola Thurmond2011]